MSLFLIWATKFYTYYSLTHIHLYQSVFFSCKLLSTEKCCFCPFGIEHTLASLHGFREQCKRSKGFRSNKKRLKNTVMCGQIHADISVIWGDFQFSGRQDYLCCRGFLNLCNFETLLCNLQTTILSSVRLVLQYEMTRLPRTAERKWFRWLMLQMGCRT